MGETPRNRYDKIKISDFLGRYCEGCSKYIIEEQEVLLPENGDDKIALNPYVRKRTSEENQLKEPTVIVPAEEESEQD
jgi:hypothetical protein